MGAGTKEQPFKIGTLLGPLEEEEGMDGEEVEGVDGVGCFLAREFFTLAGM